MTKKTHLLQFDPTMRSCYGIQVLNFSVSRYHYHKMDWKALAQSLIDDYRFEKSFHLLAENDAYEKFWELTGGELQFESLILDEEDEIMVENRIQALPNDQLSVILFQVFDQLEWQDMEADLEHPPHSYQLEAVWKKFGPLRILEHIEINHSSLGDPLHLYPDAEYLQSIAFEGSIYAAVIDEQGTLEISPTVITHSDDLHKLLWKVTS